MSQFSPDHRYVRRLGRLMILLTVLLTIVLALYAWPIVHGRSFLRRAADPAATVIAARRFDGLRKDDDCDFQACIPFGGVYHDGDDDEGSVFGADGGAGWGRGRDLSGDAEGHQGRDEFSRHSAMPRRHG